MGLSQQKLGELLGVSQRTVKLWESYRKVPLPKRDDALRRVLGLTELELWKARHRPSTKIQVPKERRIW